MKRGPKVMWNIIEEKDMMPHDSKRAFEEGAESMLGSGWRKILKEHNEKHNKEEKTLSVSMLKEYLEDIFMSKVKDKWYRDDGLLSYEEVRRITNITEEEYANSSGLYSIGGGSALTGIGGWEKYQEAIHEEISKFTGSDSTGEVL